MKIMDKEEQPNIGLKWEDFEKKIFEPEEIAINHAKAELVVAVIEARKKLELTQQELAEKSGVSQPVIARMESGVTRTQLDTMLKVLASMDKTLAIVPLKKTKSEKEFVKRKSVATRNGIKNTKLKSVKKVSSKKRKVTL